MVAPVSDPEDEVRRLRACVVGFVVRAGQILPSTGDVPRDEIIELREFARRAQEGLGLPLPPSWLGADVNTQSEFTVDIRQIH